MTKKKILVFGAGGFIGTYLIDKLIKNGNDVVASDINIFGERYYHKINVNYYSIDITKSEDFDKIKHLQFDVVIHLAALQPANFSGSKFTPKDYININVQGTINILEFCKENKISKVIYATSHRNTSGLWHKGLPVKEEDGRAQEYNGEYAMFSISESAAQDCVNFYTANYNMDGVIFRLPPVYGYGPHLEIFKNGEPIKTGFQTFIDNAKACKPLEVWGNVSVGRDIIYVKDVVDAFIKVIDKENIKGLYNICSGYSLTLKEEVDTIAKVFWGDNNTPEITLMPHKTHTMDSFVYDNSKAKKDFDWSPKFNFEQLLLDYKIELEENKFGFLLEKRKEMFKEQ